jgi:hypothetical protein
MDEVAVREWLDQAVALLRPFVLLINTPMKAAFPRDLRHENLSTSHLRLGACGTLAAQGTSAGLHRGRALAAGA